jgi:photosystem II stability/assembly factor-like uncharacterized protein
MKACSFLFPLIALFTTVGQTSWYWQNPLPQGNTLNGVSVDGMRMYLVGEAGTLIRTTDAGTTWVWERAPVGLARALAVEFPATDVGFLCGESTSGEGLLYKTTDGGQSWILLPTGPFTPLLTSLSFVSTTTGWVVGEGGIILRTTNGGADWTRQESGVQDNLNGVSFSAVTEGNVFSYQGIAVGAGGIILTTLNGGASWSQSRGGAVTLFGAHHTPEMTFAVGSGGTILRNGSAVTPSPTTRTLRTIRILGSVVLAAGDNGTIVRSTNSGVSWTLISSETTQSLRSISFTGGMAGAIVGANGTVLYTTDAGAQWVSLRRGFLAQLNGISSHRDRTIFAVGNGGIIVKTTNNGARWDTVASGVTQNLQAITFLGDTVLVVGAGTILRSTDKGASWSVRPSGVFNDIHFVSPALGIAVGGTGSVLRTTNTGSTWDSLSAGTSVALNKVFVIDDFHAIAAGNSGVLLRSTDGGQTWQQVARDTALALYDVVFVTPSRGFAVGDAVAPGLPPVMLRTNDSGKTWQAVNLVGVVAGQNLRSLFFLSPDTGYAGGTGGVLLRTTDGGLSWERVSVPTHQTLRDILFFDSATGFLVGTNGAILSTVPAEPTSVALSPGNTVLSYYLWPNFPNPFNPTTTIRFVLARSARATVTVFNLLGQQVATLFEGDVEANDIRSVIFNGEGLASGVYYYRLHSGSFFQTRTMILLR